jgi:hypothetical protein
MTCSPPDAYNKNVYVGRIVVMNGEEFVSFDGYLVPIQFVKDHADEWWDDEKAKEEWFKKNAIDPNILPLKWAMLREGAFNSNTKSNADFNKAEKQITVLATVAIIFNASGANFVSPSGNSYLWTSGRWINNATKAEATSAEAALANDALSAANPKTISFGHGARHLQGTGLSQEAVEAIIATDIRASCAGGNYHGWVQINGQWIQYRTYMLPNGTVNVGTYFPVAGNLSNVPPP